MPNDAKLGMVVGVALVIASAIFFVRKDPSSSSRGVQAAAAPSQSPSGKQTPGQLVQQEKPAAEEKGDNAP